MSALDNSIAQVAPAASSTGRNSVAELESPSLFGPMGDVDGATAYEVKFLLAEDQVSEIVRQVAGKLALDPYADPAMGNAYLTTSIYTDTPNFDVFYRTEGYARDKFRLRRYGVGGAVFVERKIKNGEKVRKQRSKIDEHEVVGLSATRVNEEWAGEWFHSHLMEKSLQPVCYVAYERVAYLGALEGSTVRVTFDRNIRGMLATQWQLETVTGSSPLLSDRVVCEFKFRNVMPAFLRGIVADMSLAPSPFSKYRNFMHTNRSGDDPLFACSGDENRAGGQLMPKHSSEVAGATPFDASPHAGFAPPDWDEILLRLGLAAVFGIAAGLAYFLTQRRTRSQAASFVATMVLLSILLGMVSMIIGSNIARAFALVGALSIVRFRTVVEDTRDTAFVIFAVVVGMAAGAGAYLVAALGIPIVGLVAGLLAWWGRAGDRLPDTSKMRTTLIVRVGTGAEPASGVESALAKHATDFQPVAIATTRQGTALDMTYSLRLRVGIPALTLINELNRIEGVQGAEWKTNAEGEKK